MKTTVEIPDVLLREVKSYAAERGLTLRQVLEASLRRTIESSRDDKPFKLDRVYSPVEHHNSRRPVSL